MQADQGLATPVLSARTGIVCTRARSASERADHFAIRHQVFVDEQGVFGDSDLDVHDRDRATVALVGYCDGVVVGTVRLFRLDPAAAMWQGDRLAVLAPYRTRGVGAPLVRCAVATAATLGGRVMTAHIQLPNVAFFERLGWSRTGGTELYAGVPHQPMRIVLPGRSEALALVKRLEDGVNERGR